jgi:hypothetical protein
MEGSMTFRRVEKSIGLFFCLALAACSTTPTNGEDTARGGHATSAGTANPTTTDPNAGSAGGPGTGVISAGDNPNGGTIMTVMPPPSMLKDGQCARQDVSTMRVTPTIWLVLDGSGSMDDPLSGMAGDKSRFDSLKEALMDPMTGIVKTLENDVSWGYIMYDGPGGSPTRADGGAFSSGPAMTCPRIVSVEPKLGNYNDIAAMYPPDPLGGSTPTDKAMAAVVQHIPMGATPQLDTKVNPTIAVLATDGAPNNLCEGGNPFEDVRPAVLDQVTKLAQANIKTYVISLAGEDQMLTQHLTDVARVGMSGKPPFIPMNKDQLVQTFKDIIGPPTACDIVLTGKVKMGSECKGVLQINGAALPCNDPNGWMLKDESTIEIMGTACDMYKADHSAVLHADFPCDVIMLN